MEDTITLAEASSLLIRLIAVAERRQETDEQRNIDAGIFWEGYQAALYDLLYELDADDESTPLTRRFANVVALDVSEWGQLAQIDAYARAGGVSRGQAIRWLVNMATAHPTRESCYMGECGGSPCPIQVARP